MRFFVRYISHTPVSFASRAEEQEDPNFMFQFDYSDIDLAVSNDFLIKKDTEEVFHTGMKFDFIIEAENWDAARDKTGDIADDLVSILAFAANTEVSDAEMKQMYELEGDKPAFRQNLLTQKSVVKSTLTKLDIDFFEEALNLLYTKKRGKKEVGKIMRGMLYYRKHLKNQEKTEEFISLYIALDSIEKLLREIFDADEKIEYECDNCGEKSGERFNQKAGRQALYSESEYLNKDFKDIANKRHEILHAGKNLQDYEFLESLRKAFRISMARLMSIQVNEWEEQIFREKSTRLWNEDMYTEGYLEGLEPTEITKINEKQCIEPEISVSYEISADGTFSPSFKFDSFDLRWPEKSEIMLTGIQYRYHGHVGHPSLKNFDFNLNE